MGIQEPSRRRHHPEAFKLAVIEACCEPGAPVAGIALANGVNANQVRRWMRGHGVEPPTRRVPMPVLDLKQSEKMAAYAAIPTLFFGVAVLG